MTDRIVTVSHRFEISPERLFDAFLNPQIARLFMFATPTGEIMQVEIEPRVGGAYSFTERRDGAEIAHVGQILQLERPSRLVFEFSVPKYDPRKTTVELDIKADGAGSVLTLTHRGVDEAYLDQTGQGWTKILAQAVKTVL